MPKTGERDCDARAIQRVSLAERASLGPGRKKALSNTYPGGTRLENCEETKLQARKPARSGGPGLTKPMPSSGCPTACLG